MWVVRFGDQSHIVTGDKSCKIGRCRTTNDIVLPDVCISRQFIELRLSASCNPENLTVCCKKTVQDNEQNTQSRLVYSKDLFETTSLSLESNTNYDISPDVGEIYIVVHPQYHSTITVCYDISGILDTLLEPTQAEWQTELHTNILATEPLTDEALWKFLDNPQPEKRPLENTEAPHDEHTEEATKDKPVRKKMRLNTQMRCLRSSANRDRKAKALAKARLINQN